MWNLYRWSDKRAEWDMDRVVRVYGVQTYIENKFGEGWHVSHDSLLNEFRIVSDDGNETYELRKS